jgi:hypothetical protein
MRPAEDSGLTKEARTVRQKPGCFFLSNTGLRNSAGNLSQLSQMSLLDNSKKVLTGIWRMGILDNTLTARKRGRNLTGE